jgi:DNA-binding SARP family transcriptional activator
VSDPRRTVPPGRRPAEEPSIVILGPVLIRDADGTPTVPVTQDRWLLTHLLLAHGRAVPMEMLIDALWDDDPPRTAKNALQVKISRLRRSLGALAPGLQHLQGAYRLVVPDDAVDARVFSAQVSTAAELVAEGDHDAARSVLDSAMALWRGTPFSEVPDHPRVTAARARLEEEWATAVELLAQITVETTASPVELSQATARLRAVLDADPLRPRARLLLMHALERSGRRPEALAVFEAGRRLLAEQSGLAPPEDQQAAFEQLLARERHATRRASRYEFTPAAPAGAVETARWLVAEGEAKAAVQLALRGAWWWWFGGNRTAAREVFAELIGSDGTQLDTTDVLRASAWLAVFDAVEADAEHALAQGERSLRRAQRSGWSRHEALAALLLAERLYQRGAHHRAEMLLSGSRSHFVAADDEWGVALAGVVEAKGALLRGAVEHAAQRARAMLREFEELGDPAGQVMALDLAGYCAEVRGDLVSAARTHHRALRLARGAAAPEWEASQLTRLGSVLALSGSPEALRLLGDAGRLAEDIGSGASLALANNGLGLAEALAGDRDRAAAAHATALAWYEQQKSPAGISYTAARVAQETVGDDPRRADDLAARAVRLAVDTGDPRAIAHALEASAHVTADPLQAARALGGARLLRRTTQAPLPAALEGQLRVAEEGLRRRLGDRLPGEVRRGAQQARRHLAGAS